MNITVSVDARELQAAAQRAPAMVTGKLTTFIHRSTERGEREMKQQVKDSVDTGQLQSTIRSSIGHLQGTIKPTAKHAPFVEDGRRPGRMPPYKEGTPLGSWARRKGIPAFLVARAIARRGTKANPFVDRTYKTIKPIVEREGTDVLSDIVRSF